MHVPGIMVPMRTLSARSAVTTMLHPETAMLLFINDVGDDGDGSSATHAA